MCSMICGASVVSITGDELGVEVFVRGVAEERATEETICCVIKFE